MQVYLVSSTYKVPAIQAVIKQARLPEIYARMAHLEKSPLREGAKVEKLAIWIPIEAGLENPHKANVAIVWKI